uniref:Uncharacterized protein n=1 Tax=Leersia perrieri TaxID=77586 RepID=A0A0D9VNP8_9ORYZ
MPHWWNYRVLLVVPMDAIEQEIVGEGEHYVAGSVSGVRRRRSPGLRDGCVPRLISHHIGAMTELTGKRGSVLKTYRKGRFR